MYEDTINNAQQQATAAWINFLNFERLRNMVEQLSQQDLNCEAAVKELAKLKEILSNPEHILGSAKTKHGEIAENLQVYIANAKRLIEGLKPQYTFDGVPRTDATDYIYEGINKQQKFYNGPKNTFEAIKKHLERYPDFLKNGGSYDIPKDQHKQILEILSKPSSQLSRSEQTLVNAVREWEEKQGVSFADKIHASDLEYSQAQMGNADKTVANAEKEIQEKHKDKKEEIRKANQAGFKEGLKVTAAAAAIEGGMQFLLAFYKKIKSGKKLVDFTEEDWKDIGISTVKGAGTGAIRGSGTYILTNTLFKNLGENSAPVANGYITAAIGIVNQANSYRKGEISDEDFLINSQVICFDAAVSVVGAAIGQAAIPIPILGAVIGSSVCNFMSGLGKEYLSKKEQELIAEHKREISSLVAKLEEDHQKLIKKLEAEYERFSSLADMAFDVDINIAFQGSIELARYVGVSDDKILKNKAEIDAYFLN